MLIGEAPMLAVGLLEQVGDRVRERIPGEVLTERVPIETESSVNFAAKNANNEVTRLTRDRFKCDSARLTGAFSR